MSNRRFTNSLPAGLAIVFVLFAVARVVSTYPVFSQTFDEPAHIAAGLQWLDMGQYSYEPQHPPLARVMTALGPYLSGIRISDQQKKALSEIQSGREHIALKSDLKQYLMYRKIYPQMWKSGNEILGSDGHYFRNLTLARLGVLPFLVITSVVLWFWTRKLFGKWVASMTVLLFSSLPPILAHAGLATTDMVFTSLFILSIYTFVSWLEHPDIRSSIILGITWALVVLAKFSAVVFLPTCVVAIVLSYWLVNRTKAANSNPNRPDRTDHVGGKNIMTNLGLAAFIGFVLLWSGYLFSTGSLLDPTLKPYGPIDRLLGNEGQPHDIAYKIVEAQIVPMPELFEGIKQVIQHNKDGHRHVFFGELRTQGDWYFFPVVFALKSTLVFLILSLVGLVVVLRRAYSEGRWQPAVPLICAVTIFLITMPTDINIGVRHILPVFALLSIVAGAGFVWLWNFSTPRFRGKYPAMILLGWHLWSSAMSHPDYLAYANELAFQHPEKILSDSDLDWGQDLYRLSVELKRRGISKIYLNYHGYVDFDNFDLPEVELLSPDQPATGWLAISVMRIQDGGRIVPYDGFKWLENYTPVTVIGKSINLYYIPDS